MSNYVHLFGSKACNQDIRSMVCCYLRGNEVVMCICVSQHGQQALRGRTRLLVLTFPYLKPLQDQFSSIQVFWKGLKFLQRASVERREENSPEDWDQPRNSELTSTYCAYLVVQRWTSPIKYFGSCSLIWILFFNAAWQKVPSIRIWNGSRKPKLYL